MLKSLLVANRGEIACRVIRTARRMGLRTIAVYSEADRDALHVRLADESACIGPAPARESYLNAARILEAARQTGAEAIHPGYGFLSENAAFSRACEQAGIVFVGPPADSIARMGSKSEARRLMAASGVPVLPGYDGEAQSDAGLANAAREVGLPLLIKPTAGGGGKGMRIVRELAEFGEALAGARREALKAFGDDRVLLERFVERGRHVEIQVFADGQGHVLHLFERDCSLQRRHQKVIEEAPAPGLDDRTRQRMGEAAVAAARAVGYRGAGTVEFLYDGRDFFFLEMNTRLQVEHPVTEMITGLDLVEWQLRVAAGEPLPMRQEQLSRSGHAVEARLYAEDPERGFLPSTGVLTRLRLPEGLEGVRVDAGVQESDEVSVHYDPMIAKIIAWAPDRTAAFERLRLALEHSEVAGVRTNARYLWDILGAEPVRAGTVSTRLLETGLQPAAAVPGSEVEDAWLIAAAVAASRPAVPGTGRVHRPAGPWAAQSGFRLNSPASIRVALRLGREGRWLRIESVTAAGGTSGRASDRRVVHHGGQAHRVELGRVTLDRAVGSIDGREFDARLELDDGHTVIRRRCVSFEFREDSGEEHRASAEHEGHFRAPMPGHVLDVRVVEGQEVSGGSVLMVLEAMKMEHSLHAPWDGIVTAVQVRVGERVEEGADLVQLLPKAEA